MIQLRLKLADGRRLLEVTRALVEAVEVPVIVNDRADIALAAGAAGVHLGADDIPVAAIRAIAPPEFIIGTSVGDESEVANSADADYVGIGPIFGTGNKLDAGAPIGARRFTQLAAMCGKPAVAIGGIHSGNVAELAECHAAGVAVIGAVLGSDDPESAARQLQLASEVLWSGLKTPGAE